MKKRATNILVAIVLAAFILLPYVQTTVAAENTLKIDQVYTNLPEIAVVFHPAVHSGGETGNTSNPYVLKYEDKTLEYEPLDKAFGCLQEITFLIDVSTSMNLELFEALKDKLLDLYKNKGENEVFRLVTMGKEKAVVLNGSESVDDATVKINGLKATADRSVFWSPIKEELDFLRNKSEFSCRAIFVFTDGAEFKDGGEASYDEIKEDLETSGIPVYAFAMSSTKSNADFLGEMARKTGGSITLVQTKDTLVDGINKTMAYLSEGYVITAKVQNLTEKDCKIVLSMGSDRDERTVSVRAAEDQTQPQIESVTCHDNQITIHFSEPVQNAGNAQAYTIKKDGKAYKVDSAVVGTVQEVVDIVLEKTLFNGNYTVTAKGIADISARSNPLVEEPFEFTVEDQPYTVKAFLADCWVYLLLAAVICAGMTVAIVVYRKKKNEKHAQPADKRIYAGQRPDHVRIEATGGKDVVLSISGRNLVRRNVKINVAGTIIIGRLASCDVSIDDPQVSRQNTALIYQNNKLYVRNLSETNGTMLNGIALREVRELQSGDTLIMGDTKIVVTY